MSTDRELLELAAKAAGVHPHDIECTWNPLTDDGDALRLAVKLEMEVCIGALGVKVIAGYGRNVAAADGMAFGPRASEQMCAVTRRAIVRAAAAIAISDKRGTTA